jgi:hypothetical protein
MKRPGWSVLVRSIGLAVACGPAAGQVVPIGSEFRVNAYTTLDQHLASAASADDGRFVVAWRSNGQDGSDEGVFAQRYDSAGNPSGFEFRVNAYTTGKQAWPSVAAAADGRFVVTWASWQDDSGYGIFGQRYDSAGNPTGPEFQINSYTTNSQYQPAVASAADGRFVVVWLSYRQGGTGYGVFGQRYDSAGNRSGPEFQVNTYTTGYRALGWAAGPAVASAPDGRFVVAWQTPDQDGDDLGVFAQRFDSAGNRSGSEFLVNSYTTNRQFAPSAAFAPDGRFVLAWMDFGQDGSGDGVFAQRYDSAGSPSGPAFRVNSFTTGYQAFPSVASAANGRFVVAWHGYDLGQDSSGPGIFAQRYDSAGNAAGPQFRVNSHTTNAQRFPSVASAAAGRFVVAWNSEAQDGSGRGVFGQRFGGDRIFGDGFDPSGP